MTIYSLAAAPAANLLQLCLILCDPIDSSPQGCPVPGILQARTLEWVAISFSNVWKWKVKVKPLSHVRLLVIPWTAAYQAPPSMGFSRQEYWNGVPLPSPIQPWHTPFPIWNQSVFPCPVLGCNLKNNRMISVHFQGKLFNISVIQVYAPTSNEEEAEVERFYENVQDLLQLTPKKYVLFIIGDWNAKTESQETSGVTGKFGLGVQNEAG